MKLFSCNFPFATSEAEITGLFQRFGVVDALDYIRDTGGVFRGFCFVTMNDAAATAAISALNGSWFGGRKIAVKVDDVRRTRMTGRVYDVSADGCYARIRTAGSNESVFLPAGQWRGPGSLSVGRGVEFELLDGVRGPVARDARPIGR